MVNICDSEFLRFVEYIKCNYGINLQEKKVLLEARLQNIIRELNFENFSQYYDYILKDQTGNAIVNLLNKVTTNYTYFFRECEHFNYFNDVVLSYLEKDIKDKDLRIWSAGCSTGEEPYTLSIIINEYFKEKKLFWDTSILATDISNQVLESAKAGVYDNSQLNSIPDIWREKYFKINDEGKNIINDKIRNEVIFRIFNLMNEDFPFKKKFHVIFCRNVMIYFDTETRNKLINKFYDSTEHGGYLFIGHSESIDHEKSRYKYIMPAVYRKE